jgi:hypothetical protein
MQTQTMKDLSPYRSELKQILLLLGETREIKKQNAYELIDRFDNLSMLLKKRIKE